MLVKSQWPPCLTSGIGRLTLNFWHRVTNLPNTSLAKKTLLENIALRTNWIKTIEKLINTLNLADKIGNHLKFKKATKLSLENGFKKWWKKALDDPSISRLLFYRKIKSEFGMENYLKIPGFQQRRHISKLRCSDHALEIEKGRHKKGNTRTLANERICTLCKIGQVEDEEHFLLKCDAYKSLRTKHKFEHFTEVLAFFNEENLSTFEHFTEVLASFREWNLRAPGIKKITGVLTRPEILIKRIRLYTLLRRAFVLCVV